MTFMNPIGLVGLVMVPILILLYLLKRRTHEKTVSSTFLWKLTLKYMKRRIPFNFRNSLLMLLQLLTVVLVSLILANPYVTAIKTEEVIVIVDGSASMMTESEGVSRFDRVKAEVRDLSLGVDQNSRVTVIYAGEVAEYAIKRSDDQAQISVCLDDYTCSWGDADMLGALQLAYEAQLENVDARILLYTDRRYDVANGIEVIDITKEEWNVAALSLYDTVPSEANAIFAGTVISYGKDASVAVALFVDGVYTDTQIVDCVAGVETSVVFRNKNVTTYEKAEIRIDNSDPLKSDHFPHDNSYFLYPETPRKLRIQLYQQTATIDRFLNYALYSNSKVTGVDTVTSPENVKYEGYDIYIFDGTTPERLPEDGAVWLINAPDLIPALPFAYGEEVVLQKGSTVPLTGGVASGTEDYEILSRSLMLTDVVVSRYTPIIVQEGVEYETVLTCSGKAVAIATRVGRVPVMAMTIAASNFQPTVDYPLFIQNLIEYSSPVLFKGVVYPLGTTVEIHAPVAAAGITITHNGVDLDMLPPEALSFTFDAPGRYDIVYTNEDGDELFSYHCFVTLSIEESDIYCHEESINVIPMPEGHTTSYEPVAIWPNLLIILALVYLLEWGVYHRD